MNGKKYGLLFLQLAAVGLSGAFCGDTAFAIGNAMLGVLFNFLVSMHIPIGFLVGFLYAVTNGILAFQTGVYATFVFMILIQAPMAVYSFVQWHKKQNGGSMKRMHKKQLLLLGAFMAALGLVMYFVLTALNSNTVLFDDIFFVCSVTACFLLAFYYKNAYIITLFSGAFGTVLWSVQFFAGRQGLSVAVFYLIVLINSVIAVIEQYKKPIQQRKEGI